MDVMPTYEYRCTSCGNRFDAFQRLDEAPLETCQRCGGSLRKVFHPAGIVFKGSGFYATDSRTKTTTSSGDGSKDGSKKEGPRKEAPKRGSSPSSDKKAKAGESTS
jgi:putative FmdB family regulatory protein